MAACHRYQDNDAKTGQSFGKLFHHTILGRFCVFARRNRLL
jgi:hypothetical protein